MNMNIPRFQPTVIDTSLPLPEETAEELALVVSPGPNRPPQAPSTAACENNNVTLLSLDGNAHHSELE